MWGTAGETGTNSLAKFSSGFPYIDTPVLANQQRNIHQLCVDTGCQLEDLPRDMDNKEEWQKSQENLCYWYDDNDEIYIYSHIILFTQVDYKKYI